MDDATRRLSNANAQCNKADADYLALKSLIEIDFRPRVAKLLASKDIDRYFNRGP